MGCDFLYLTRQRRYSSNSRSGNCYFDAHAVLLYRKSPMWFISGQKLDIFRRCSIKRRHRFTQYRSLLVMLSCLVWCSIRFSCVALNWLHFVEEQIKNSLSGWLKHSFIVVNWFLYFVLFVLISFYYWRFTLFSFIYVVTVVLQKQKWYVGNVKCKSNECNSSVINFN